MPRLRAFYADLAVINGCLDGLIARAKRTRQADDAEALQARDYSKVGCAGRRLQQPPSVCSKTRAVGASSSGLTFRLQLPRQERKRAACFIWTAPLALSGPAITACCM